MPYDKYHVTLWDWGSLLLCAACLVPASFSMYNLYKSTQRMQELDMRESMVTGATVSTTGITSQNMRDRIKELRSRQGSFKYLLSVEPLTLIFSTACVMYLRLVTDVIGWLYSCFTGLWDWFIIVVDGISLIVATLGAVMLLFVFIQRYYLVFDGSLSMDGGSSRGDAVDRRQRRDNANIRFTILILLTAMAALFGVVMGVASFSLRWQLLGFTAVGFVVFLFAAASLTLWFYFRPLLHLASLNEMPTGYMLHASSRLTVVSVVALCSICVLYSWAAFAYATCKECTLVYIYYNLLGIDTVINLQCLVWTLKTGQRSYFNWCACAHYYVVGLIENSQVSAGIGPVTHRPTGDRYLESISRSASAEAVTAKLEADDEAEAGTRELEVEPL